MGVLTLLFSEYWALHTKELSINSAEFKSQAFLVYFLLFLLLFSCSINDNKSYDRYVVLSPEIAEILSYLGVMDSIVGITAECNFPVELQSKEIIGNFGQYSLESIIALNPTIVFTTALEQAEITSQLNKLNISTQQFYPKNTDDLLEMIQSLGTLTNTDSIADSLAIYLQNRFTDFLLLSETRNIKPRVYIEIYGNPIMSADNSSYLGQLLMYAGADNIFPKLIRDYAMVSPEDVVSLNPDIIILTYPGISASDVQNRMGWSSINAIQNNRIYTIDDVNPDIILRASPRNIEGIERLIGILYE